MSQRKTQSAGQSKAHWGREPYKPRQSLFVLGVDGGSFKQFGLELRDDLVRVGSEMDSDGVDHVDESFADFIVDEVTVRCGSVSGLLGLRLRE